MAPIGGFLAGTTREAAQKCRLNCQKALATSRMTLLVWPMPFDIGTSSPLPHFKRAFSKALQVLLAEKHLYQSELIDWSRPLGDTRIETEGKPFAKGCWHPEGCPLPEDTAARLDASGLRLHTFPLLPIQAWCSECQEPTEFRAQLPRCRSVCGPESPGEQELLLSFACKVCMNRRITFLVSRKDERLQLSGRDPIETLPLPTSIPKSVARFYAEAQLSHKSGHCLAALYLLREFIEQFWRLLPEVQDALSRTPRMNAGEIAGIYGALLPLDFRTQYPSLMDCHRALTAAIQEEAVRPDVFQFCSAEILDHLDGRRFRRLPGSSASPFENVGSGPLPEAVI